MSETQQQLLDVLRSLDFGQDAAEHEPDLARVFVDTDVYHRLTADQIDLVVALKGLGKTAMYRMITETTIHPDLAVLKATNPTGTPVFKVLFNENCSEARLRGIWSAYLASILGNWVVDKYEGEKQVGSKVAEVREVLESLGLRKPPHAYKSLISRIRKARSIEGGLSGSAAGEVGASLKFDLPDANASGTAINLEASDFLAIFSSCARILRVTGHRVWIAIDRLDECFTRNSEIERRALRALLRTQLDIAQTLEYQPQVRLKVFLRTDLLTSMSDDATFTNSTHLRRADLRWSSIQIGDLVHQRSLLSTEFTLTYLLLAGLRSDRESVLDSLVPLRPQERRTTPIHKLCEFTSDGHRAFSPRNVISALSFATTRARDNQRRRLATHSANRPLQPLIKDSELHSALGDLSRQRLQDSVLNEFPGIRQYVDRLAESGQASFPDQDTLAQALKLTGRQGQRERAIDQLLLSGVLGRQGSAYLVPRLYRAALRVKV